MAQISKNIYRKVTEPEYKFLNTPMAHISLVVKVKGSITEDLFRESVNKLTKKHILLRVKIMYDQNKIAYFSTENVPQIPIHILKRESDLTWRDALINEHKMFLDPKKSPLARFVLILGKQYSDIIIFANHAICDGMSLSFLVRDLLTFISNPSTPILPIKPIPMISENIKKNLKSSSFKKKLIGIIEKKWNKNPVFFDQEDFSALYNQFWKSYEYSLITHLYSEEETKNLLESCHQNKVSVNAALCTAYRGALELYHEKHLNHLDVLGSAIDVRDYAFNNSGDFFGFFALGVNPKFKYIVNKPFWDNARKLHSQLNDLYDKEAMFDNFNERFLMNHPMSDAFMFPVLSSQINLDGATKEKIHAFLSDKKNVIVKMLKKNDMLGKPKMKIGQVITNLGKLKFDANFGKFEIESVFLTPSSGLLMELVIGVATIRNRLGISLGSIAKHDEEEKLKEINKIALKLLNE